jgi:glycosyltransferase involved in cell wall biosynthesis
MTLVSVGVPVRNGAASLRTALESIRRQTHTELEVLISDNASTDDTAQICAEYASRDTRFRVLRHAAPVSALANLRSVFEATRGPYFLWAAHDDWRAETYVEVLLAGLERHSQASVAFSDVILFEDLDSAQNLCPLAFHFETEGLAFLERLRKTTQTAPFHIYGLIRRAALQGYPWYETEYAPDWPIMLWLAARGDFVRVPGTQFLYYRPPVSKTEPEKAAANAYRRLGRLARERMAWMCADAVLRSGVPEARGRSRLALGARMYVWQHRGFKNLVFTRAPRALQVAWRRLKPSGRAVEAEP